MQFKEPIIVLIKLIMVIIAFIIILGVIFEVTSAESSDLHEMFVICRENDYIHIRRRPSKRSQSIGWLECGDSVMCDGKEKNGYLHIIGKTEYDEGWVYKGYLVNDPPIDNGGSPYYICAYGRVACRKSIDGKRRCWANPMETVKVLFWSEEWCLTNKGFIQTKYLEPDPS